MWSRGDTGFATLEKRVSELNRVFLLFRLFHFFFFVSELSRSLSFTGEYVYIYTPTKKYIYIHICSGHGSESCHGVLYSHGGQSSPVPKVLLVVPFRLFSLLPQPAVGSLAISYISGETQKDVLPVVLHDNGCLSGSQRSMYERPYTRVPAPSVKKRPRAPGSDPSSG